MATFSSGIGYGRANRFLSNVIDEACAPVKHHVFDTWYYARRMARTPSLGSMRALLQAKPENQPCWKTAFAVSQCQALFKKRDDLDLGIDREAEAIRSFHTSEKLCYEMNRKLRNPLDPDYRDRATLISKMQRKISEILGNCPHPFELDCGFGPGVNVGCKKTTTVTAKLSTDATSTRRAALLLRDAMLTPDVHWPGLRRLTVVDSSEFSCVPKSWKTDRGIMIEPIVNTYLQKGIGSTIRERLRRHGVDLNDQSHNRTLALVGSRNGSLATIDLSMASDTIASLLVLDLLPSSWFELLYRCRCDFTVMPDGKRYELEKFSSMGNGYTFELESLIFYSLCRVVCPEGIVSVYGDDLIVPSDRYDQVIAALRLLGFVPNDDKSFGSGPFRESCGGDFFGGINIRPFYLKTQLRFSDLFRFHNWAFETGYHSSAMSSVIKLIPAYMRSWGPPGFGDGYLHSMSCPTSFDKKLQVRYFAFKHFVAKPRRARRDYADYFAFIYYRTFKDLGEMMFDSSGRNLRVREPEYIKRRLIVRLPF